MIFAIFRTYHKTLIVFVVTPGGTQGLFPVWCSKSAQRGIRELGVNQASWMQTNPH